MTVFISFPWSADQAKLTKEQCHRRLMMCYLLNRNITDAQQHNVMFFYDKGIIMKRISHGVALTMWVIMLSSGKCFAFIFDRYLPGKLRNLVGILRLWFSEKSKLRPKGCTFSFLRYNYKKMVKIWQFDWISSSRGSFHHFSGVTQGGVLAPSQHCHVQP